MKGILAESAAKIQPNIQLVQEDPADKPGGNGKKTKPAVSGRPIISPDFVFTKAGKKIELRDNGKVASLSEQAYIFKSVISETVIPIMPLAF